MPGVGDASQPNGSSESGYVASSNSVHQCLEQLVDLESSKIGDFDEGFSDSADSEYWNHSVSEGEKEVVPPSDRIN